ncbi:MAG: ORF6N domain-containing protein [candidate division NC10 bacterium]|nr:ORF6N domain-containing protein [candidate division NC10 bacterium]
MPEKPSQDQLRVPVESLIITLRGQRVILDSDLARIYGVKTGALNRAVKRNLGRFPEDFVFQLTTEETTALRCQPGISKRETAAVGGRGRCGFSGFAQSRGPIIHREPGAESREPREARADRDSEVSTRHAGSRGGTGVNRSKDRLASGSEGLAAHHPEEQPAAQGVAHIRAAGHAGEVGEGKERAAAGVIPGNPWQRDACMTR